MREWRGGESVDGGEGREVKAKRGKRVEMGWKPSLKLGATQKTTPEIAFDAKTCIALLLF